MLTAALTFAPSPTALAELADSSEIAETADSASAGGGGLVVRSSVSLSLTEEAARSIEPAIRSSLAATVGMSIEAVEILGIASVELGGRRTSGAPPAHVPPRDLDVAAVAQAWFFI